MTPGTLGTEALPIDFDTSRPGVAPSLDPANVALVNTAPADELEEPLSVVRDVLNEDRVGLMVGLEWQHLADPEIPAERGYLVLVTFGPVIKVGRSRGHDPRIVKRILRAHHREGKTFTQIANELAREGRKTPEDGQWRYSTVRRVVESEYGRRMWAEMVMAGEDSQ